MKRLLLFAAITIASVTASVGQSRYFIKECIREWGACREVAITDKGGDIALNGTNQFAHDGISKTLAKNLQNLHDSAYQINDVQLTEKGRWLINYGNGLLRWHKIPVMLRNSIFELIASGQQIRSVTFNDDSEWIVVSDKGDVRSSFIKMDDWVEAGRAKYGALRFAQINNEGMILAYERGYMYLGNVSQKLKDALRAADFDVTTIKFTPQGAYFFAGKDGSYIYNM